MKNGFALVAKLCLATRAMDFSLFTLRCSLISLSGFAAFMAEEGVLFVSCAAVRAEARIAAG